MVWSMIKDNDLKWFIILAATIISPSYEGKLCTVLIKREEEHLNKFFIQVVCQKFEIFPSFYFRQKVGKKKNVFDDILDRKKAFLENKNIDYKKSRKLHLVHGFCPNFQISSSF